MIFKRFTFFIIFLSMSSSLFAAANIQTMNVFNSGEVISSSKMNNNFNLLDSNVKNLNTSMNKVNNELIDAKATGNAAFDEAKRANERIDNIATFRSAASVSQPSFKNLYFPEDDIYLSFTGSINLKKSDTNVQTGEISIPVKTSGQIVDAVPAALESKINIISKNADQLNLKIESVLILKLSDSYAYISFYETKQVYQSDFKVSLIIDEHQSKFKEMISITRGL